jgi:nitroimidazol reductase NimA-like FMN-containing flavoprotein (pyridoxamine 5'-phosphate oxidase superfamily)
MSDARLDAISEEACLRLLRAGTVGRVAFVDADGPSILPVNYRLVEPPSGPLLAIRTRPGNVIDQAPENVAFEIDSIDQVQHRGWSVLVRGSLVHAFPDSVSAREHLDSAPWISTDRESWLFIDPWAITGRELRAAEAEWVFRRGEYL